MIELPENDQGNLKWNLDAWQLDFLLPWNLERMSFKNGESVSFFWGLGGKEFEFLKMGNRGNAGWQEGK